MRAHGFRYCFTPLPGCFSPFPHGTCPLSVAWEYSGLDGGPPGFGPGSSCPALLRHRAEAPGVRVRGSNPVPPAFPGRSASPRVSHRTIDGPATPAAPRRSPVWPRSPFARRYSGNLCVDFSSSGYLDVSVPPVAPSPAMCSPGRRRRLRRRVHPFGDPRVVGRVPLTADYRSLPRPSSAPCAKASALRP